MKRYRLITPEGMRDTLFSECRQGRGLEKTICKIFSRACYNEVRTPVLEFYDVFNVSAQPILPEEMHKLSDAKGRLMVLRPDNTLPVVRLAASKLREAKFPLRIYYNQPSFRISQAMRGSFDETAQAGVELIGAAGRLADMEVLSLAVDAISAVLPDFRFEIGHSGIFRALSHNLPLSDDKREELRFYIESKNYAALTAELDMLPDDVKSNRAAEALRQLPRLFGGEDVLSRAGKIIFDPEAASHLAYLGDIYKILCDLGLADKVIIDLGLVQRNDYYTGIVFSAYAPGLGESLLIGGRYDNLLSEFGHDSFKSETGAVGFAFNLDALNRAVSPSASADPEIPQVLVVSVPGKEASALRRAAELRAMNISCELSHTQNTDDAQVYAFDRGIEKVEIV